MSGDNVISFPRRFQVADPTDKAQLISFLEESYEHFTDLYYPRPSEARLVGEILTKRMAIVLPEVEHWASESNELLEDTETQASGPTEATRALRYREVSDMLSQSPAPSSDDEIRFPYDEALIARRLRFLSECGLAKDETSGKKLAMAWTASEIFAQVVRTSLINIDSLHSKVKITDYSGWDYEARAHFQEDSEFYIDHPEVDPDEDKARLEYYVNEVVPYRVAAAVQLQILGRISDRHGDFPANTAARLHSSLVNRVQNSPQTRPNVSVTDLALLTPYSVKDTQRFLRHKSLLEIVRS